MFFFYKFGFLKFILFLFWLKFKIFFICSLCKYVLLIVYKDDDIDLIYSLNNFNDDKVFKMECYFLIFNEM